MPESKARTAQVQTTEGWIAKSVSQLQPGDRFRLIKPDGSVVASTSGATEFTAGVHVAELQPAAAALRGRMQSRFAQLFAAPAAV